MLPVAACINTSGTPVPPLSVYRRWTPGETVAVVCPIISATAARASDRIRRMLACAYCADAIQAVVAPAACPNCHGVDDGLRHAAHDQASGTPWHGPRRSRAVANGAREPRADAQEEPVPWICAGPARCLRDDIREERHELDDANRASAHSPRQEPLRPPSRSRAVAGYLRDAVPEEICGSDRRGDALEERAG